MKVSFLTFVTIVTLFYKAPNLLKIERYYNSMRSIRTTKAFNFVLL